MASSRPSAPQSAGSNSPPGTSLPLGGAPQATGQFAGGSTPPTASGMGQGYCSFPLNGSPSTIGMPADPAVQQQLGSMVSGSDAPYVAPNQQSPNANPNRGAL